jgi:hypothetical protein
MEREFIGFCPPQVEHIFASEPNTRWTCRLRSTNQAGSSPWGPEQTLTTRQGAPGHVLNLQLTPLSPNEIRVRWSPPAVQRGTIVRNGIILKSHPHH